MRPILTIQAMRKAEAQAIAAGTSVETLMERAGGALAEAAIRFAGPMSTLILCGPGNNGGDGYVAARHLAERGVAVRVAALGTPRTEGACRARAGWNGPVEQLGADTAPASRMIDCLFGTGLKYALESTVSEQLIRLADASLCAIAADLPSGIASDSGALLSAVPDYALTVAFGALKPAHQLYPAAAKCGRVVTADIGIEAVSHWHAIGPPELPILTPAGHKYDRGMVVLLAGAMPGAIALAATAAARTGAGFVRIDGDQIIANVPAAIVQGAQGGLDDRRIGALLVGPGLGKDNGGLLDRALASGRPLVLDADALVGDPERFTRLSDPAILTPHEGEFIRLFGTRVGSKVEQALEAARISGCVLVYKGPDTLVASPDGRAGFAPPSPAWLASAGSGDVLAGMVAAMRARGLPAYEAACAAVWLHGRAAEAAGPGMIADDLAAAIPHALDLLR